MTKIPLIVHSPLEKNCTISPRLFRGGTLPETESLQRSAMSGWSKSLELAR